MQINKISELSDFDWLRFNGQFPSYRPNSCSLFCNTKTKQGFFYLPYSIPTDSYHRPKESYQLFLEKFLILLFGVMVGAWFVVGSSVIDSSSSPCLCLDAGNIRSSPRKKILGSARNLELGSSFTGSRIVFRLSPKRVSIIANRRSKKLLIVNEDVAGNYEDTFGDVQKQIVNYFTYKAVRTVLHQLYEMNPPQYTWFYNHIISNRPTDGKRFLRALGKENQELAERVMITRLHLYGKWIKKCDHGKIYQDISDENLALMRERLMETVIWPSDDSEVVG